MCYQALRKDAYDHYTAMYYLLLDRLRHHRSSFPPDKCVEASRCRRRPSTIAEQVMMHTNSSSSSGSGTSTHPLIGCTKTQGGFSKTMDTVSSAPPLLHSSGRSDDFGSTGSGSMPRSGGVLLHQSNLPSGQDMDDGTPLVPHCMTEIPPTSTQPGPACLSLTPPSQTSLSNRAGVTVRQTAAGSSNTTTSNANPSGGPSQNLGGMGVITTSIDEGVEADILDNRRDSYASSDAESLSLTSGGVGTATSSNAALGSAGAGEAKASANFYGHSISPSASLSNPGGPSNTPPLAASVPFSRPSFDQPGPFPNFWRVQGQPGSLQTFKCLGLLPLLGLCRSWALESWSLQKVKVRASPRWPQ